MLPIKPGTPSLFEKCTGLFYVRYTNNNINSFTSLSKDAPMGKCPAEGHKCQTGI